MQVAMRRPLLALLISIPLVSSGAAGIVLHVCQSMGGLVAGDCACDQEAQHGNHQGAAGHAHHGEGAHHLAHEAATKLQSQPCCTVELSSTSQTLATQKLTWQGAEQAPLALVDLRGSDWVSSREACELGLLRERAPPNIHGPPIFMRNCSFLN